MSMTQAQVESAVRNYIDDPVGGFWSSTNLRALIATTFDEKWTEILNFSPYYRSTLEAITGTPKLTASGTINIPSLASRFYKIQSITRDGRVLDQANPRDIVMYNGESLVGPTGHYALYGDQIYMFPIDATTALEIRYSSLPTALSAWDSTVVTWPEGTEFALIFECAARTFLKGDREDNSALRREADRAWQNVLSAVKRTRFATTPYDLKSSLEFGGT